jgi:hypothetical protein
MALSNSEKITHSTVRIEVINERGQTISTGSGFFFRFSIKGVHNVPVLVTNKHVVKDAKIGRLVFTIGDDENNPKYGEKFSYSITDFEKAFIFHPSSDVDLCIMPMQPIFEDATTRHSKNLFTVSLDETIIPSIEQLNGLSVMEDVIMVGYPNGLWDQTNNLPIIRRGITAVHPKFDYNGKTDIVVDMACFPGSSGSPIFIHNQGSYPTGDGIAIGNRVMLLGVLYAGPQMTAIGDIQTKTIPTADVQFSRTNLMINIGYAVKSRRLMDFKPILEPLIK